TGLSLADMVTVLDDLSSRLHRLRQDDRPLVRMAFEQSWALLDDETQDAFSATAVFEGRPFGIHAFAAVAGVQLVEGRLLLARLRERSLLNQVQAGRFALHPLLTAFALEKLPASAPAWPRFVDYYYNLLDSGENRTALVRQEMWDYAAAMRAAHALADWRRVLIFNEWLQPVWRALGHYTLARECAAMAFEAARANGEKEAEAEILYHWGVASLEQSRHAEAETHLVGALELFESVEADRRAGDAYFFLARNALARDDFQRAQETVQSAWQAYQKAEDVRGMGRALHRLAHIQFDRGQNARALELVNDAIKTQQEAGDKKEWFSSAMLGITICVQMGDLEKAAGYCRMAEALLPEIDDPVECAVFDYAAANLSRLRGHFEDALERGLKALAKFQDMHDLKSTANTFNLLAGVEAYWNKADPERRQFATGLGYCDQGLAICELIDYTLGKALLLMFQGWLLGQRGDLDSARLSWQESERLAAFMKNSWLHQRLQDLGAEFGVTRQDI
ncbi:MAG: hypothetical protein ACK2UK_19255, partial [Candidatus Promineifilaceae bacterium]